jgi:anthraniloyl-CoA monooxygenase
MRVGIVGGGPAGLYCGLLLKKSNQAHDISIIERNAPDATYGWGVVFSDRTLAAFQEADFKSYRSIIDQFVPWDAIDIYYQDQLISCGGHVFAGLERKLLLQLLQARCAELEVTLSYNTELADVRELDGYDLVIAADGVGSLVRASYREEFQPELTPGKARYIWLGTTKLLSAFTFIFRESEHGLLQAHAYPFSGRTGTFIVECHEETWLRAGLDSASPQESIAYCEKLFAPELRGTELLSNNSRWVNFITVKNARWHHQNVVLLGDAAHTAHFSIGSGTKLAMEDAISLVNALETFSDLETALAQYEVARKPVIELFQAAAAESQAYFESVKRYTSLPPLEFCFNLLTRSGRLSYDDLRLRDPRFSQSVDQSFDVAYHYEQQPSSPTSATRGQSARPSIMRRLLASPPALAPLQLRRLTLANRIVQTPAGMPRAEDGVAAPGYQQELQGRAEGGAGLVITGPVAVSGEGRISPECLGAYNDRHLESWKTLVERLHSTTATKVGMTLCHAGRRGSVRPPYTGLDQPLPGDAGWPLYSASAIPYTPHSRIPGELDARGLEAIAEDFVQAARLADAAGFDLLQLHMAHGYLLASFLSPLTNSRTDTYGGSLRNRMRYPLEVFQAVRAVWPEAKPLTASLGCVDGVQGGLELAESVEIAGSLKANGCDLITVQAGYTVPDDPIPWQMPPYGAGFLTPLSDRIRNQVGIATLVGGYLTTANQMNTILAGGRADLCLLYTPAGS